jgi:hypothetical protein
MGNPETTPTLGYDIGQRQANEEKKTENWKVFLSIHWCTCLLKYITRGKYCLSRFYVGGSQPKRNVAGPVLEFGFQLHILFH